MYSKNMSELFYHKITQVTKEYYTFVAPLIYYLGGVWSFKKVKNNYKETVHLVFPRPLLLQRIILIWHV